MGRNPREIQEKQLIPVSKSVPLLFLSNFFLKAAIILTGLATPGIKIQ